LGAECRWRVVVLFIFLKNELEAGYD